MSYLMEQVKVHIAQQDVDAAMGSLISSLQSGKKALYEQALTLSRKLKRFSKARTTKQKEAKKQTVKQLDNFLSSLEQEHQAMLSFLEHVQAAEEAFSQEDWLEAQQQYKQAKSLHQADFQLSEDEILHKIELCHYALQYKYQVDEAEVCLDQGNWNQAITHFTEAQTFLHGELPFMRDDLDNKIHWLRQGLVYEHHLVKAEELQSKRKWEQARLAYQQALSLYQEGLNPDREWIEKKIEEVDLMAQASSSKTFLQLPDMWAKLNLRPIGWLSLLLILICAFWFSHSLSDVELSTSPDLASQTTEETFESTDKEPIDATPRLLLPIDSVLAAPTPAGVNVSEEEFKEVSETPIIEASTARIQEAAVANIPTFEEQQLWAEIDEDMKEKERGIMQDPKEEVLSRSMPEGAQQDTLVLNTRIEEQIDAAFAPEPTFQTIAVIPFCDGIDDAKLLKRLYLDATFSLKKNSSDKWKTISKNTVSGMLDQMGGNQNQSCSKLHSAKLGRALNADFLLTGSVERLEDEHIQVSCRVLEPRTGKFSHEVIITDKSLTILRDKLKNEIPKLFN